MEYPYGNEIQADSSAALGNSPEISWFEIVHGDGGGVYRIIDWCHYGINWNKMWKLAGSTVMYKHP